MDPIIVAVIGLGLLFLLMFLGLHVGIAMLLVGFVGLGVLSGMGTGVSLLGISPFATTSAYLFSVLPLFILMGLLAHEGGLVSDLFEGVYKLFGSISGGLAIAVIWWCAAFAAITGETLAASMIMSKIAFPEMRKYNYDAKFSAGAIAAGGTLGILIPPSAGLVLYGMITETNIGALLIAGILPGILLTTLFTASIIVRVKFNPNLASAGLKYSWRERLIGLQAAWPPVLLFLVVIGGIYAGIFTPTEGGAAGVVVVLILVLIKRKLTVKGFNSALKETMRSTGMVFLILVGAMIFNYFLSTSRLPMRLADIIIALGMSKYVVFTISVLVLLLLGCIMDVPAMILLSMPILFPIIMRVGFDPVWYGVVSVILSEAGAITPPIGMNSFVVAGVLKEIPLWDVFRGIWPFLYMIVLCLILITIFPQICTLLPSMMMK